MSRVEVPTKYGSVKGVPYDGYTLFKGIPYAKPPVRDLRFEAPQDPSPWEGTFVADTWPTPSFQAASIGEGFYGKEFYNEPSVRFSVSGEDCLYLNIWTPFETGDEKLPVAVWIHGGAFGAGFSWEQEFDGAAFAKEGVILVTIGYRLGVLGFLAHPALSAASDHHISGNYGALDQIAALKWVQENIDSFGGDPGRVTVFGQSAGAISVQTIIASPLAKGLFARAIIQSGGGYHGSLATDFSLSEAEALGEEIMAEAGLRTAKDLKLAAPETLSAAYRKYTAKVIERAMAGKGLPKTLMPMSPIVDGYVLKDGYNASIEKGYLANVPYMIGSNADDIGSEAGGLPIGGGISDEQGSYLYHGAINFSHALEKLTGHPAYVYRFGRKMPGDDAGAFHSAELWYVFGTYAKCWRPLTEKDARLSRKMVIWWTNFMKTGNPSGKGDFAWKPCTMADPYVNEIDI